MLYQVSNGSKYFGAEEVFENVQFEIKGTEKIAIVGRNGCGKTTFLKCMCGEETFDKGVISKPNVLSIGYLSQKVLTDEDITVEEELKKIYAPIFALKEQMNDLENQMAIDPTEKVLEKYAAVQEQFELNNGYNWEAEMRTVFSKFGFDLQELHKHVNEFSGGQKTRIAFVKLLLSKPDILLLDEPTNHLDVEAIEWLEGYVRNYPKAVVIVSHDRMFLDRVVSVVYDMELGNMKRYAGNYSSYVDQKKNDVERQMAEYARQQKDIERLEHLIEKFRYKKNKAAFAQSKIKYLDRMEKIEEVKTDSKKFKARFSPAVKGGEKVLETENLVIGYDRPLATISMKLMRHDIVAIIGPNGTGKSTLVKTLMGLVPKLGGSYLLGHQIDPGYFDQQLAQFSSGKTVLEEVWDEYPDMDRTTVRTALGRFLFSADDVFKLVDVLSGGEKVRLSLAKLMLQHNNFLILDEPTNHLDIPGKESLEDALKEFEGTILFVSHDRYFISRLATKLLVMESDGSYHFFEGTYQEYTEAQETNLQKKEEVIKTAEPVKKATTHKAKNPEAIRRELAKLERMITEKEQELEEKREWRFEPEYYQDAQKMNELDQWIDDIHNELAHLYAKWEELSEE